MLVVESGMCAYVRKFGIDENKWGIVGLLYDFDYEWWLDLFDYLFKGLEILL